MTSVLDYRSNVEKIQRAAEEIVLKGVRHLFLPECFYSLGDSAAPTPYLVETGNEHYRRIRELARQNKIWLIGGSVAAREGGKVVNRALNFSPTGEDIGYYDKRYLFRCHLGGRTIDEGDIYTAGTKGVTIDVAPFTVGLGLCFDLRYPELGPAYVRRGVDLLTYASAFTVPTGKAHWHTLLKARGIENQCFVVAAAQWGRNNPKVSTYGHSLVVGPWGEVLADGGEGERIVYAELKREDVERVRRRVSMGLRCAKKN